MKTGIRVKSKKAQARDAELGLIIEEFGRAMWNANKEYIAAVSDYMNGRLSFTGAMNAAWYKYVEFCFRYGNR